jgi:hypothetical protein
MAIKLFRGVNEEIKADRGFYFEWANAEGETGDYVANTLLAAFSISDSCSNQQVNNDQARRALAGLGLANRELFNAYHNVAFRDARMAATVLGKQLRLDLTTQSYFQAHLDESLMQGAKTPTVDEAFNLFHQGLIAAEAIGADTSVASVIAGASKFNFNGLLKLITANKITSSCNERPVFKDNLPFI